MSFKRLDTEDVTISAESIVAPAWSGQQPTLTTMNTSLSQVSSTAGGYYYDMYQTASNAVGAAVQFSIAYGNRKGSGSVPFDTSIPGYSPSSVIYGQYRTLLNGDEDTDFKFGTITPDSIYVLSVNRSRFKEKLYPGTLTLVLLHLPIIVKLQQQFRTQMQEEFLILFQDQQEQFILGLIQLDILMFQVHMVNYTRM